MTCRHCHEPVQRCTGGGHFGRYGCNGWVHSRYGIHACTHAPKVRTEAEPQGRAA